MLRTKNIITRFEEVDETWAFEYYLKSHGLKEKLEGQSVNLLTPFKEEATPSFFLFHEGRYFFKCFATDLGGDVYEMVKHMFDYPNKAEAITRVWNDYENYLNGNNSTWVFNPLNIVQPTKKVRFHIETVEMRKWNEIDATFWKKYHITRQVLEDHNVSALEKIIMKKIDNGVVSEFVIANPAMYGYYNKRGELCKIYQPGRKKGKYLRIRDYIQGSDQLDSANENLLITKALKDVMGFKSLGIKNWNTVAPNSENELIPSEVMNEYKGRYKKIRTLFDNDDAGRKAAILYKESYALEPIYLDLGHKDLTDTIECVKFDIVKHTMSMFLN